MRAQPMHSDAGDLPPPPPPQQLLPALRRRLDAAGTAAALGRGPAIAATTPDGARQPNGPGGGSPALHGVCGADEGCAGGPQPPPGGGRAAGGRLGGCRRRQGAAQRLQMITTGLQGPQGSPPPRLAGPGPCWSASPSCQRAGRPAPLPAPQMWRWRWVAACSRRRRQWVGVRQLRPPAAPAGWLARPALQAASAPASVRPAPPAPRQEIFVINDDITVEKPIDDYYAELDKRLQGLKSQLGSDADWMPSTYEKYMTGQHQVAGSLQRNVREYYNDFKLLRADTQVRAGAGRQAAPAAAGTQAAAQCAARCSPGRRRRTAQARSPAVISAASMSCTAEIPKRRRGGGPARRRRRRRGSCSPAPRARRPASPAHCPALLPCAGVLPRAQRGVPR